MCHRQSRGPQDLNTSSCTAASLQTQVLDLFLAKLNVCNYVICLPTEHQEVHKNLFRNSHAFQEFGNFGFGGEGKTRIPKEKPLGVEQRTNNKFNAGSGNRTWDKLVEGERYHHCTISTKQKPEICLCLQANLLEQTTENRKLLIHTAGKCCTIMQHVIALVHLFSDMIQGQKRYMVQGILVYQPSGQSHPCFDKRKSTKCLPFLNILKSQGHG